MTDLLPCPFCGGPVSATYEGSSDWQISHLDEAGRVKEFSAECVDVTIHARATEEQWERDENAERNIMAAKWNARR
jgi:hypothetical protein